MKQNCKLRSVSRIVTLTVFVLALAGATLADDRRLGIWFDRGSEVQILSPRLAQFPVLGLPHGTFVVFRCPISMMRLCLHLLGIVLALTIAEPTASGAPMMVNIGGRNLYLSCSGKISSPVVILEAGGGGTSESWDRVQSEVAKITRVCSYDRAGSGKSDAPGHQHSMQEHVADLHALLQKAGIKPPYIFVGHSLGGLIVRRYQTQFSGEVVGMVLVDSAHEEQLARFKDIPGALVGPPANPANWLNEGFLLPGQHLQWHVDMPLIVLEHGRPIDLPATIRARSKELEQIMHEQQRDLASRSSKGQLRTAKESGHDIPAEKPKDVIDAIHDVLRQTRSLAGVMHSSPLHTPGFAL